MAATEALPVHPANAGQLRAWDGDEGAYWADHADRFDRAVIPHHRRLLSEAAIGATERVLDIGCGTGQTTRDAARAAASGSALGVDLSSKMIEHARSRAAAEGVGNVRFEQVDAQIHPFDAASFDVAVSRTGTMFFGDLVAANTNIARALRPGGRLVAMTWQPIVHNEWIREFSGALAAGRDLPAPPSDAPGPFALSEPDRVRAVLTSAGFTDVALDAMSAPMWFGTDADDAYRFVLGLLGWMLDGLDGAGRTRALDALRATTAAHQTAEGVVYESGAWIIRAVR
jgi:SAM-dependent methyltransferase